MCLKVCGLSGLSWRTLGYVGALPEKSDESRGMMNRRSSGRRDCSAASGEAGCWFAWLCGLLRGTPPPIWCTLMPGPPPMLKTKPFPPPVKLVLVAVCRDTVVLVRTKSAKRPAKRTSTTHAASKELSEQLFRADLLLEHRASTASWSAL